MVLVLTCADSEARRLLPDPTTIPQKQVTFRPENLNGEFEQQISKKPMGAGGLEPPQRCRLRILSPTGSPAGQWISETLCLKNA